MSHKVQRPRGHINRRRGNPHWGKTPSAVDRRHVVPTSWDRLLVSLGLTEADVLKIRGSRQVRDFVYKHKNNLYIPEEVLAMFGQKTNEWDDLI